MTGSTLEHPNAVDTAAFESHERGGPNETGPRDGCWIPRARTKNSPLRVLVVDDEFLMRWSIAEALKAHGHTVLEADNGAAALRVLHTASPPVDVVLLDYCLPDTQSLSLLDQIRRRVPPIPVILMTAFGTPEIAAGAVRLGAYDVMDKPFEMNEIEAAVSGAYDAR